MKLSWKDVLYPHAHIGDFLIIFDLSVKLGYRYFVWNDWVYDVRFKEFTKYSIEDIQ